MMKIALALAAISLCGIVVEATSNVPLSNAAITINEGDGGGGTS